MYFLEVNSYMISTLRQHGENFVWFQATHVQVDILNISNASITPHKSLYKLIIDTNKYEEPN